MKIAVCLSGHMRTYKETVDSLHENLLKPLAGKDEYDIFIYTCQQNDMSVSCLKNPENSEVKPVMLSEEDTKEIMKCYRPKKIVFENKFDSTGLGRQPMLRRIGMCDKLRLSHEEETGKKYDLVIRVRPDTFFLEKFESLDLRNDEIMFFTYGRHHGGYYDGFAIGSGEVIKKYSEFYLHSEKIRIQQEGHGQYIKVEKALKAYIDSLNLQVSYVDKATYTLRSWGQKYAFFDQSPITFKSMLAQNQSL